MVVSISIYNNRFFPFFQVDEILSNKPFHMMREIQKDPVNPWENEASIVTSLFLYYTMFLTLSNFFQCTSVKPHINSFTICRFWSHVTWKAKERNYLPTLQTHTTTHHCIYTRTKRSESRQKLSNTITCEILITR